MREEYFKNTYKEISELSNTSKCKTTLIQNTDTNELAVKKEMPSEMFEVYSKLANINSAGIVNVLSCHTENGKCIDIEEYVNGKTLETIISEGQWSDIDYANCVIDLCDTLTELHSYGIIHRDIQPKNIIVDNNRIKLIDFDIARNKKESSVKDTRLLGTPEFASPEAYGFSQTDERSDVYSLGKLLDMTVKDERFKEVIKKSTEMDPVNRYQSAGELKMALMHCLNNPKSKNAQLFIRTVPGFRSNNLAKKTIASIIYFLVIALLTGTALQAKGNVAAKILSVLLFYIWVFVPYAFLMNIGNISSKLIRANYKSKTSEWLVRIALCIISFIITSIMLGFFMGAH